MVVLSAALRSKAVITLRAQARCPSKVIAGHFAVNIPFLRGCPHSVLGNQCMGTGTKWCCVHTSSTRYVTVCKVHKVLSPCQTPFSNMSLVARTKQWTAWNLKNCVHTGTRCPLLCPNTRSRPCTRAAPARCPNSSVGT